MLKIGKEQHDSKTAIILFNLGGPDKLESVRPFLYNLFSDKWIIRAPFIIRKLIALFISYTRVNLAKKNYSFMGGFSPLLNETNKQRILLENSLNEMGFSNFEIFISMRYWHPFSSEIINKIKEYSPHKVIYLPLYPQCSSSTTVSSFEDFDEKMKKTLPSVNISKIGCYFDDEDFVNAHINLIKESLNKFQPEKKVRILFSAHSIPKKFVKEGDPYEWQINMTYQAVKLGLKDYSNIETILCYQSKVGPIEWLAPSTEAEVEKCAKEGVDMLVVPIAFVSEHIETLVELDIEYKEIAEKHKVRYERVPALGGNEIFIKALAKYIIEVNFSDKKKMSFNTKKCDDKFLHCMCRG